MPQVSCQLFCHRRIYADSRHHRQSGTGTAPIRSVVVVPAMVITVPIAVVDVDGPMLLRAHDRRGSGYGRHREARVSYLVP